jgi:hypothetical protein
MAIRWIPLLLVALLAVAVSAQEPTPEVKETPKANSRPVPPPDYAPEPFDKADVKTMASKCVSLDTEAGVIEMRPPAHDPRFPPPLRPRPRPRSLLPRMPPPRRPPPRRPPLRSPLPRSPLPEWRPMRLVARNHPGDIRRDLAPATITARRRAVLLG